MIWAHRAFASIEYGQFPKSQWEATHGQNCFCLHLEISCENTNFNPLQNVWSAGTHRQWCPVLSVLCLAHSCAHGAGKVLRYSDATGLTNYHQTRYQAQVHAQKVDPRRKITPTTTCPRSSQPLERKLEKYPVVTQIKTWKFVFL